MRREERLWKLWHGRQCAQGRHFSRESDATWRCQRKTWTLTGFLDAGVGVQSTGFLCTVRIRIQFGMMVKSRRYGVRAIGIHINAHKRGHSHMIWCQRALGCGILRLAGHNCLSKSGPISPLTVVSLSFSLSLALPTIPSFWLLLPSTTTRFCSYGPLCRVLSRNADEWERSPQQARPVCPPHCYTALLLHVPHLPSRLPGYYRSYAVALMGHENLRTCRVTAGWIS